VVTKKTGPDPLPAHPLVLGLTASAELKTGALGASRLAQSATDVAAAINQAGGATAKPAQPPTDAQLEDFSVSSETPPFTLVAGYLGGGVQENGAPARQVLFLDAQLSKWLLVPIEEISLFNRVKDDSAAFGLRDILWLTSHARVIPGDASDSVRQSYLSGPFTRADQVPTTVTGGTFPGTGGLLMEAITPGCCGKTR
jgi:hypothetical protein